MGYRIMGALHAALAGLEDRARREEGQGTVEYVGLILLIAAVVAGVIAFGGTQGKDIGAVVVKQLKGAIEGVGGGKP